MKKITLLLLLLAFTTGITHACLNAISTAFKDGNIFYMDYPGKVPYGHIFFSEEELKDDVTRLDSIYQKTKDLDYLSDKGLVLIVLGQYDEAINLYLEIEELEPNRYSTASNIGTAYELAGQNEYALHWIKRSVEIDPKSHMSSEWLHVKILEAKIGGAKFYNTPFLLNTDFGVNHLPTTEMTHEDLEKLLDALYYQLNERVSFVKPKEEIVAQLLFDLGNVAFLTGDYHEAGWDYGRAKEYGLEGPLIEERIAQSNKLAQLEFERQKAAGTVKPR
ncbi:MAG: tetratricopeptide repeat protein [Taibaiella sp.]|jgi:tetratricopeptide (TPR) repeat protein